MNPLARRPSRILPLCMAVIAPLFVAVATWVSPAGATTVPGAALPVQEFVSDNLFGRAWNAYNQTVGSGGPTLIGRSAVLDDGNLIHFYGRGANSDLVEFVNDDAGGRLWNSYDLSRYASGGAPVADSPTVVFNGLIHVYVEGADGDLMEYVNDDAHGQLWSAYDLTVAGRGGWITGTPSAVWDGALHIYVRGANGHLMEYVNDDAGGSLWNSYDLSSSAGGDGGTIAGSPAAVHTGPIHVYVMNAAGNLIEYVNDGAGGHLWNAYDQSALAGGGGPVSGTPSVVVDGAIHLYVRDAAGDLVEYVNDGADGHTWNEYDLSDFAGAGTPVVGSPAAVVDQYIHVFARAPNNHLVEYVSDGAGGHLWNAYDLTALSQGPTVGEDPTVLDADGVFHVYSGGPLAPGGPPLTGVGVYGIASLSAATQAIDDGWPVLGDTGGLGTCGPPYTNELTSQPDLNIGSAVSKTQVRVTWLSFWTVSGPDQSGQLCNGNPETTTDTWYTAGLQGGQTAAEAIDNDFRTSGVKPDYVILDPEGYNGAPTTPQSWQDFLQGWYDGVTSVDPSLRPAFYANQSQYYSGGLTSSTLPAFVAVSPILMSDDSANQPFAPDGGFGAPGYNVTGYIAYGDFTANPPQPTCPALAYENAVRNWGAPYNTIQFPDSGVDCAP